MVGTTVGLDYRVGRRGCRMEQLCRSPGKHPLTPNGVKYATTTPDIIKDWWAKWPRANIGICTGRQSNLLVLDVDPRNGGDETLKQLIAQYGKLPETPLCATGGGGWHYYFQHPGAIQLGGKDSRYPGLDVKGNGGYVAAPRSGHYSGGVYHWLNDWRTTALAPVPDWLLQLIRKEDQVKDKPRKAGNGKAPLPAWTQAELRPKIGDPRPAGAGSAG